MGCSQSSVIDDISSSGQASSINGSKATKQQLKKGKKSDNKNAPQVIEPSKPKATYANYSSSHNAKQLLESDCNLRGVTFLNNGDLVAADYKNNKLKLFSAKFEFLHDLELSSAPWDVCQASDNPEELFATVPYKKEVNRISITLFNSKQRLVPAESFRTDGFCWGVTCFDGGVAVSVKVSIDQKTWPKPPEFQVHIHEFDGTFRRAITCDPDGAAFFSEPKYLNVTYDDLFLLVSDYKLNTVLCMNNEDELIFAYKDMKSPNGIAMDEGKNLHIVSFFGAQRVHKVGANGKYKDGLPHNEDRPLFPHGICYRKKDKVIVMTTDQSIEVYKLV